MDTFISITKLILILTTVFLVAEAQDVVCKKGKTKKKVMIGEGDSFSFRTQAGDMYAPKTKCVVMYKRNKATCPMMMFTCSQFNIYNKDSSCRKKDRMILSGKGRQKRFCQTSGPDVTTSDSIFKVSFFSDKKRQASGAVCTMQCTTGHTTTTTVEPDTTTTTTEHDTTTSTEHDTTTTTEQTTTTGVCGSDNNTYTSHAEVEQAGAELGCDWPCPCERNGVLNIEEGGIEYTQTHAVRYTDRGLVLRIEVEAHNSVPAASILFESEENTKKWKENYLMRFGSRCFLVKNTDPDRVSNKIQGLNEGTEILSKFNKTIIGEREEKIFKLIQRKESSNLTLTKEMLGVCQDDFILEAEELSSDVEEYATLNNGGIIFSKPSHLLSNNTDCEIRSALTFEDPAGGCYHWINPGTGGNISVHEYVTWVDTAYCCYTYPGGDPTCCQDIIDNWEWNTMIAPDYQGNFCHCEEITDPVMFNICFEGTVGTGGGRK